MVLVIHSRPQINYAFCDGHVEGLKLEQTLGPGTLTNPKGGNHRPGRLDTPVTYFMDMQFIMAPLNCS